MVARVYSVFDLDILLDSMSMLAATLVWLSSDNFVRNV